MNQEVLNDVAPCPSPLTEPTPRVLSPRTFWIRDTLNTGSVECGSWQRPVKAQGVEEAERQRPDCGGSWRPREVV